MKNIILIFTILLCSCNSRIHSGIGTISKFELSNRWSPLCSYTVNNRFGIINSEFLDTCNKFKVGDTVSISTKR